MRCPACLFEGNPANGRCVRCGYDMTRRVASAAYATTIRRAPSSELPGQYTLMRGDTLAQGRYRIVNPIVLPESQQRQGKAWSAMDMQAQRSHVVIREIVMPQEFSVTSSTEQVASMLAQLLQSLGQYAGFPQMIDLFREQGTYFMALLYPQGESLGTILKRQGGALPEPLVAEYGYQLCGLLSLLSDQQPPLVHGAITPETVIVNDDSRHVALIHLPLFQPDMSSGGPERGAAAGYSAPEQARGEADASSDLYAVAAIMHHAVTGYDPLSRLTFFHPPARRLNPAVTPQMEYILARQLSLSKSQRYAHSSEMQKDLTALITAYPAPASDEPPAAADALVLSASQLREQSRSATLLNTGVFAAISVLLLLGVLFAILRP